MSWSVDFPCYNCGVIDCKDRETFENACCGLNNEKHHGAGTVRMDCHNFRPQPRAGYRVLFIPPDGPDAGKPQPADVLRSSHDTGHLVYGRCDLWVVTWGKEVKNVPYSTPSEFGHYRFMDY